MFISKNRTEEMISFLTKDKKKIRFNHLTMEPHSPFQSEVLHKYAIWTAPTAVSVSFTYLRTVSTQLDKISIHYNPDDDDDGKVKVTLEQATKAQMGSRGIHLLFL